MYKIFLIMPLFLFACVSTNPQLQIEKNLIDNRYLDNKDGTVTDIITNRQWMRCNLGQRWNGYSCLGDSELLNWKSVKAIKYTFAGHNDWVAPSIGELNSLIWCSNGNPDYYPFYNKKGNTACDGTPIKDYIAPSINPIAFPNAPNNRNYWSSSQYSYSSLKRAWSTGFNNGYSDFNVIGDKEYLRLVRNAN